MAACGTYAGYNTHGKKGETPCQPCRDAANAYQRQRWNRDAAARSKKKAYDAARKRAVQRLIVAHRGEFLQLFDEERTKEAR